MRITEKKFVSVIIPAGGSGSRMKSGKNKLLLEINGKTVIEMTLKAFDSSKNVDEIIIALPSSDREIFEKIVSDTVKNKKYKFATGGETREHSVKNALEKADENCDFVLIHDAARPFISPKEIDEIIKLAYEKNSVCAGYKVKDTVKITENGKIEKTLDRNSLFAAATPQIFKKEIIKKAFDVFSEKLSEFTDDAGLVEALGEDVFIYFCDEKNIKITTPKDIVVAKNL